jgi:hypothetical protein
MYTLVAHMRDQKKAENRTTGPRHPDAGPWEHLMRAHVERTGGVGGWANNQGSVRTAGNKTVARKWLE